MKSKMELKLDEEYAKRWENICKTSALYSGLSEEDMEKLIQADEDKIFDELFWSNTGFHGIRIFPRYATPAMRKLEEELYNAFTREENLSEGKRLIELRQYGNDFYATKIENNKQILFKVKALRQIGRDFVIIPSWGNYMFVHYEPEDIGKVAPAEANSYLIGTIMLVELKNKYIHSPIVAGDLIGPINRINGNYHVLPVKFFNSWIDWSKRYEIDWERREDDGIRIVREVVKDPKGKIISRSHMAYFIYSSSNNYELKLTGASSNILQKENN
jgi:hypothetical protein